jgi:pimeloyl-ACP methyl ester carboxylesterase
MRSTLDIDPLGSFAPPSGETTMPKKSKSSRLSRRSFAVAGTAATIGSMGGLRSVLAASDIRTINFRVVGTDEPTLILVHGLACTLEDWDAQVRGLSPRFRCAALDLPGHGGSAIPATVSIATMAEAVNTVKDLIGSRRAILIGHSMGCRVIMEAFQQSPINIVGLVFIDGSFVGGGDPVAAIKKAKDAIDRVGIDAFTQRFFNDMFLEGSDFKLRKRLAARAQGVNAGFREKLFLDLVRWDQYNAKDVLKGITIPALVLQSTFLDADLKRAPIRTGMTTPWMDLVASLVQKSEAKIIPGAGHFAMIEAAPAVNHEIQTFATHLAS